MVIPYKFAQMINTMKFRSMTPGLTSGAACSDFFGVMQAWLGPVPNNQEVLNRQPRSHTAEDLAKSAFVSKPEFIDFLETECQITLLSHVANPVVIVRPRVLIRKLERQTTTFPVITTFLRRTGHAASNKII